MISRLNHVAIVVPDLAAAAARYRDALDVQVSTPLALPEHGVTVVFVELPNSKIELLEPLGADSPVRGFLDKNPSGGMHHLCYEVDDIIAARDRLRCSSTPRISAAPSLSWNRRKAHSHATFRRLAPAAPSRRSNSTLVTP